MGYHGYSLSMKPVAKLQSKFHLGDADSVMCMQKSCLSPTKLECSRCTGCLTSSSHKSYLPGQRWQNLNLQLNLHLTRNLQLNLHLTSLTPTSLAKSINRTKMFGLLAKKEIIAMWHNLKFFYVRYFH